MITFACHTWTFPDLMLPETFAQIARLGFSAVDIGSGAALNAARAAADPQPIAADLRADLAAFALTVTDLYLVLPRITGGSTVEERERRTREIELFRALVPFAAELGAPGITLSPGLAPPSTAPPITPPDADSPNGGPIPAADAAFEQAADALRRMLAAAQSSGLKLSIEPHLDSIAPTHSAALALIAAVPGLLITLDWAEQVCQNTPPDALAALLPHTRHVHVRGAAKNKLQTPLEKSTLDPARVYQTLADAGYSGAIAIELIPPASARHGAAKLAQPAREAAALRDALKSARDGGKDSRK